MGIQRENGFRDMKCPFTSPIFEGKRICYELISQSGTTMYSSFPSLPSPFDENFFIIDGYPITKDSLENIFLEALEGVGSCLFVFPQEEGRQKYRFYAVTSYKAPFPQNSNKGERFCDWSYFTDDTTTNFNQSWWLYKEEGYTEQEFRLPHKTKCTYKDLEYVPGPRKEIRKRFFSQITRDYHELNLEVIPQRFMGVGPLYGQPNLIRSLDIPFQKSLKEEIEAALAKDILSMLGRGISLLRSATRWQKPSIGADNPTMIDIVRGVQWQLIIAYSGFELLFKGMYVLLTELPESIKQRLTPDIRAAIEKIPKSETSSFTDLFFNKMKPMLDYIFETQHFTDTCLSGRLCFQQNKSDLGKYWSEKKTSGRNYLDLNKNQLDAIKRFISSSPTTPRELISIVTAIRHACAHGMLSPSRIVDWNMFPSFIAMIRGILWMGQEMMDWTNEYILPNEEY